MQAAPANIFDTQALASLKLSAKSNSPEAAKEVAKQFETLFMQMLLKQMRDAMPSDGPFNSESTRFYQSLYDQQLGASLAQHGGLGLAASIERQLSGLSVAQPAAYDLPAGQPAGQGEMRPAAATAPVPRSYVPHAYVSPASVPMPTVVTSSGANAVAPAASARDGSPQAFVESLWAQAVPAAASLGVPPHFLVGHAALETGWGKSEIKNVDGSPSHNLFNIKAGGSWTGRTVDASTIEYENGAPRPRVERFRAYNSYAEAFADYASLIRNAPRYRDALGKTDASQFSQALQSGGYATDPAYANKLTRVINGGTLRQSLLASAAHNL